MKKLLSVSVSTLSPVDGLVKLGQPVPDSNLSSESNSVLPQQTQRYIPGSFDCAYLPVNAGSVPFCRVIRYCSGVSSLRHSSSDLRIFSVISIVVKVVIAFIIRRSRDISLQALLLLFFTGCGPAKPVLIYVPPTI